MRNNIKLWNIALVTGVIALATSVNASAEDELYDSRHNYGNYQKPAVAGQYDQQYKLPKQYNGRYYPNDEPAIGYHGSTNTSDSRATPSGNAGNTSYYYYYQ